MVFGVFPARLAGIGSTALVLDEGANSTLVAADGGT